MYLRLLRNLINIYIKGKLSIPEKRQLQSFIYLFIFLSGHTFLNATYLSVALSILSPGVPTTTSNCIVK